MKREKDGADPSRLQVNPGERPHRVLIFRGFPVVCLRRSPVAALGSQYTARVMLTSKLNLMLELKNLSKRFQLYEPNAVNDLSLEVNIGELLALLGPSGCGKTTMLRILAGLERADAGSLNMEGQIWQDGKSFLEPEKRGVGLVFQDYALFGHLNVLNNVLFGLHGQPKTAALERAHGMLERVGLSGLERRFPHELSGGQQQRVALARALAPQPRLLLLDEPFSNLDAALRSSTRAEVKSILKAAGVTTLLVTHDQEEALSFADTIALMRAGRLEQIGTPREMYLEPRTAFSARFMGRTNLLEGSANGVNAETALGVLELSEMASGPVRLSLRPEQLKFAESGLEVRIGDAEYLGTHTLYTCLLTSSTGTLSLEVRDTTSRTLERGDLARVRVKGVARVLQG